MTRAPKYKGMWVNPYTGKLCYVAFNGSTLIRVEDVVPGNTRIFYKDEIHINVELEVMQKTLRPFNPELIKSKNISHAKSW